MAETITGEPTPDPTVAEKADGFVREVIGGDKRAAVRRIILWVLAFVLLAGGAPLWITLMPLALLCLTDGLL